MDKLAMDLRTVDDSQRLIIGIAVPYDETTYRVPGGERVIRGAFKRSIQHKGGKIPLACAHDPRMVMGYSQEWEETPEGLLGSFRVNEGEKGTQLLEDVRNGYYPSMSVGFEATRDGVHRAPDGVREVREAKLVEVSLCGIPAYDGAAVLAVRSAQDLDSLLAPFQNIPKWDLDPLPPLVYRPQRH
jgi:HK97 family phage prohead protease